MSVVAESARRLQELSLRHADCLVFFSGGKDSLACLSLARRHFRRVVAVHMYLVPGLAVVEGRLAPVRERRGVEVYYTPHWLLSRFLRRGVYCMPERKVKEVGLPAVIAHARAELGIDLVVHGRKRADGTWQRWTMTAGKDADLHYPLAKWNKWDVLGYLQAQKIDAPEKFDIDLSTKCLLWLAQDHPEDFAKVCEVFPHAPAAVCRRDWYGAGASNGGRGVSRA
jgi:hypothetical protein